MERLVKIPTLEELVYQTWLLAKMLVLESGSSGWHAMDKLRMTEAMPSAYCRYGVKLIDAVAALWLELAKEKE